jgi:hypothetical protein
VKGQIEMVEQHIEAHFQRLLDEHYELGEVAFHSLNTRTLDDNTLVYQVYQLVGDQASWVLTAAHEDLVKYHTYRFDVGEKTVYSWLLGRARILMALSDQHYPASRVLPANSMAVTQAGPWSILVTNWSDGNNGLTHLHEIEQAGMALAQLHIEIQDTDNMGMIKSRNNLGFSLEVIHFFL